MEDALCWPRALRRYVTASLALHLTWEIAQLPFYTIYWTEPFRLQVFAIFHCTAGDGMIAGLSLLAALAAVGSPRWPTESGRHVWIITIMLGIGYTILSEWLNVSVRGTWAYSALMPTLPIIGTGLSPLLQWFVIPTISLWIGMKRQPWLQLSTASR